MLTAVATWDLHEQSDAGCMTEQLTSVLCKVADLPGADLNVRCDTRHGGIPAQITRYDLESYLTADGSGNSLEELERSFLPSPGMLGHEHGHRSRTDRCAPDSMRLRPPSRGRHRA